MQLVEHGAEGFAARAWPFLLGAEAEHNLIFGIVHTLRTAPHLYPDGAWMATVEDGDAVVGVALHTPPNNLIATRMPVEAAALVARARQGTAGVSGPAEIAHHIAALSGRQAYVRRRERIYECTSVTPAPEAPGSARLATVADDDVVMTLRRGFAVDVGEPPPNEAALARYRAWVAERSIWLWEDGEPVCLTAAVGPTPSGIRIGAVYTPPAHRRRGYATSLVAAVTAAELGSGRRACFLFTDLANPTSNAIYQRIGYRPVCDLIDVRFAMP